MQRIVRQTLQAVIRLWLTLIVGVIVFIISNILVIALGSTTQQAVMISTLTMVVSFVIREQVLTPAQDLTLLAVPSLRRRRLTTVLKVVQPLIPGLELEWRYGPFGGPNWCALRPGDSPRQRGVEPTCSFTVASELSLSLEGFQSGVPVSLRVVRPDGEVLDYSVTIGLDGRGNWDLAIHSGNPVGKYRVTAAQGALVASGVIVVQRPGTPRVFVEPRDAPRGSTLTVSLAGFPPNQRVPIFLYRFASWSPVRTFRFLNAEVPPVTVDRYGEAIFHLTTALDDPEGWYLIHTQPHAQGGPEFEYRTFVLGSVGIQSG